MTSIGVFRSTAFSCLSQLQGNERGVRETDAPEFIHQARVAIRRLRSAIRLWRPLLPEEYVKQLRPALADAGQSARRHPQLGRLHYRDPAADQQGVPGSQPTSSGWSAQASSHLAGPAARRRRRR
jgi:hypothetical protein